MTSSELSMCKYLHNNWSLDCFYLCCLLSLIFFSITIIIQKVNQIISKYSRYYYCILALSVTGKRKTELTNVCSCFVMLHTKRRGANPNFIVLFYPICAPTYAIKAELKLKSTCDVNLLSKLSIIVKEWRVVNNMYRGGARV